MSNSRTTVGEDEALRISSACEHTVLSFTAHFDAGEYVEMEAYFAPDGRWKRADGEIHGIAELRERMGAPFAARRLRSHVVTNLRTRVESLERAVVDSYFTLYLPSGEANAAGPSPIDGPAAVGRYHDELVCINGRWRIQLREPFQDFRRIPKES